MINTKQANAVTGREGYEDAVRCADLVGQGLDIASDEVLLMSTGVIGERLKMNKIEKAIPGLIKNLDRSNNNDINFAQAIMTTG